MRAYLAFLSACVCIFRSHSWTLTTMGVDVPGSSHAMPCMKAMKAMKSMKSPMKTRKLTPANSNPSSADRWMRIDYFRCIGCQTQTTKRTFAKSRGGCFHRHIKPPKCRNVDLCRNPGMVNVEHMVTKLYDSTTSSQSDSD